MYGQERMNQIREMDGGQLLEEIDKVHARIAFCEVGFDRPENLLRYRAMFEYLMNECHRRVG